YCWGRNDYGQLGDGTTTERTRPTNSVNSSETFIHLGAGEFHTCGVAVDGDLFCWGRNNLGQLGDNSTTTRTSPTAVDTGAMTAGDTSFIAVSSFEEHTCGISGGGKPYCWGNNADSRLGDNTTTQRNRP